METYVHMLLARCTEAAADEFPGLEGDDGLFLGGAVYPDRTRKALQSHLYTAQKRAVHKLDTISHNLALGRRSVAEHELGVALHYLADALDRSKKLHPSRNPRRSSKGFVRDVQQLLVMGWLNATMERGSERPGGGAGKRRRLSWPEWIGVFTACAGNCCGWQVRMLSRNGQSSGRRYLRRLSQDKAFFAKVSTYRKNVLYLVNEAIDGGFWDRVVENSRGMKPADRDSFRHGLEKDYERIVFEEMLGVGVSGPGPKLVIRPASPRESCRRLLPFLEDDFTRYFAYARFVLEHYDSNLG